MGIFAEYDLTKYAYQDKEPSTVYSIDCYQITIYDMDFEYGSYIHDFDNWTEVRNYIEKISTDNFYENYNFSLVGLVFD